LIASPVLPGACTLKPLIAPKNNIARGVRFPSRHSPRTPAGMPTVKPWSSGSRSASTTASSGCRGACSNAYCPSAQPLSGASKRTTYSGPGSRASPSVNSAAASWSRTGSAEISGRDLRGGYAATAPLSVERWRW